MLSFFGLSPAPPSQQSFRELLRLRLNRVITGDESFDPGLHNPAIVQSSRLVVRVAQTHDKNWQFTKAYKYNLKACQNPNDPYIWHNRGQPISRWLTHDAAAGRHVAWESDAHAKTQHPEDAGF